MNINCALLQAFPDFLHREPGARQVREQITIERRRLAVEQMRRDTEDSAQCRRDELRFPFLRVLRMFDELDFALNNLGPGNIAPTPKTWRGRTRDAGDGGGVAVVLDGNHASLARG